MMISPTECPVCKKWTMYFGFCRSCGHALPGCSSEEIKKRHEELLKRFHANRSKIIPLNEGKKMNEKENHLSWRLHDLWSEVEDFIEEGLGEDVPQDITKEFNDLYYDLQILEDVLEKLQKFTYSLKVRKNEGEME